MLSLGLQFDNKRLMSCQIVRHSGPQWVVVVPSYGRQGSLMSDSADVELVHCCTLSLCYLGGDDHHHHQQDDHHHHQQVDHQRKSKQ